MTLKTVRIIEVCRVMFGTMLMLGVFSGCKSAYVLTPAQVTIQQKLSREQASDIMGGIIVSNLCKTSHGSIAPPAVAQKTGYYVPAYVTKEVSRRWEGNGWRVWYGKADSSIERRYRDCREIIVWPKHSMMSSMMDKSDFFIVTLIYRTLADKDELALNETDLDAAITAMTVLVGPQLKLSRGTRF